MSDEGDQNSGSGGAGGGSRKASPLQALAGEILRTAVTLGAGAYVRAEDTVSKTLNTVQMPLNVSKAALKELLDSFVEAYSIEIKASINFTPKKKGDKDK